MIRPFLKISMVFVLAFGAVYCPDARAGTGLAAVQSISPEMLDYAFPERPQPDAEGLYGQNAKAGRWLAVHFQRGAMIALQAAIAKSDKQAIDVFWPALNKAFANLREDGNFVYDPEADNGKRVGPSSQPTDNAFFLGEAATALLLLLQSPFESKYQDRVVALLPRFRLATNFISDPNHIASMVRTDRDAANRMLIDAKALILGGLLTQDAGSEAAGNELLLVAIGKQSAQGIFPERGGADASYQGVSLVSLAEICLFRCTAQVRDALNNGLHWEVERVGSNGTVNTDNDTRTNGQERYWGHLKTPDYRAIVRGLALSGAVLDDSAALSAAEKVVAHQKLLSHRSGGSNPP